MKENCNLEELPKRNVYKVPEGYFEQLPSAIMQRCTPKPKAAWWSGLSFTPMRMALATLVLGGVLTTGLLLNKPLLNAPATPDTAYRELAEIPNEQIVQYLLASGQVDALDMADMVFVDGESHLDIHGEEFAN